MIGPLFAALIGIVLGFFPLTADLRMWYLLHLVFLLPFFGDGRALLLGLRTGGSTVEVGSVEDSLDSAIVRLRIARSGRRGDRLGERLGRD